MSKQIIIIGGGVAGLAAAAELRDANVTLLEAKDCFGGRIQSRPTGAGMVELGAEFLHGESEPLRRVMDRARLTTHQVSDANQVFESGRLHPVEVWDTFSKIISQLDLHARDVSFLEFLRVQSLDSRTQRMMLAFAEGFNAAHAGRLSAHSLRRADYSAQQMEGETQARMDEGYSALVAQLVADARAKATLITGTVVRAIHWQPGHVRIETTQADGAKAFDADAAVITLPLGVLKARTVEFHPALPPEKDEAIRELQFGNVTKITLTFRRAWWPDPDFGFIHALDEDLPTWWSHAGRLMLTGWSGGPRADALLELSPVQLESRALEILARIFPGTNPRAELVASHTHNWFADPHQRGAYTYVPVGGLFLPRQLAAPVHETLYFAGEATALDAQLGTVFNA